MALVRVELENGTKTSVGEEFAAVMAEQGHLKILTDEPATSHGRALSQDTAELLKGKPLNDALTAVGLETSGTLAERQERLSAHQTSGASVPGGTTPAGPTGA